MGYNPWGLKGVRHDLSMVGAQFCLTFSDLRTTTLAKNSFVLGILQAGNAGVEFAVPP